MHSVHVHVHVHVCVCVCVFEGEARAWTSDSACMRACLPVPVDPGGSGNASGLVHVATARTLVESGGPRCPHGPSVHQQYRHDSPSPCSA